MELKRKPAKPLISVLCFVDSSWNNGHMSDKNKNKNNFKRETTISHVLISIFVFTNNKTWAHGLPFPYSYSSSSSSWVGAHGFQASCSPQEGKCDKARCVNTTLPSPLLDQATSIIYLGSKQHASQWSNHFVLFWNLAIPNRKILINIFPGFISDLRLIILIFNRATVLQVRK